MLNRQKGLITYLALIVAVCTIFIWAAKALVATANLVAGFYMLTPAIAALLTRAFVYEKRFRDARLRLGNPRNYLFAWLGGIGAAAISYAAFTLAGSVTWDVSGQGFLRQMDALAPGTSKKILESLPEGMTLTRMLLIYTVGGLTLFNLPGIVLGFGEEFGWRDFMFPQLYQLGPWVALVGGGLIWWAWHLPLGLLGPDLQLPPALIALRLAALAVGGVCTFTLLAWIYVKSGSVWVPALFHTVMNNASRSLSYWVRLESQLSADLALVATMALVVLVLWNFGQLQAFRLWDERSRAHPA